MKYIEFSVPGDPVPQGSMRAFLMRMGKKFRINQVYQNQGKIKKYRKAFQVVMEKYHDDFYVDNSDMAYVVEVMFYLKKPKTVNRQFPTVIGKGMGDVDKFLRAVLDALTYDAKNNPFGLFKDDAQVIMVMGTKLYAEKKPETCVRIVKILMPKTEEKLVKAFNDNLWDEFKDKV